jgi:protein arginine kinase
MIPGLEMKDVNEILVLSRPNFVQKVFGTALTAQERDVRRADLIRKHLASRGV